MIHTCTIGFSPPVLTPLAQLPLASVMPTTRGLPSGPSAQHRLPWLCHCISGPAKASRLGSSVGRALAMYIAPASVRWIAVDGVDQRLRLRGVEEDVVLDERRLDVVLAAGAGVADRGVAVGDRRGRVGVLRQVPQRVLDQRRRPGPPARVSRPERRRRRSAASDPTGAATCAPAATGDAVVVAVGCDCAAATRRRRPLRRVRRRRELCGCDSSTTPPPDRCGMRGCARGCRR